MFHQPPKGYVYHPYPAWRTHPTLGSVIVNSPEEDAAVAAQGYRKRSDTSESPVDVMDALRDALYATTVKDIESFVADVDVEALESLRELERRNPRMPGGRQGVFKAIDAREEALTAPSAS